MKAKTSGKFEYFVPESFPDLLATVKKFLKSPEPGVIVSAPFSGTQQRLEQIVQNHSHEFDGEITILDIGPGHEDMANIHAQISSKGLNLDKDRINLMICKTDYCLETRNTKVINDLTRLHKTTNNIRVIFFFESNIYSETHSQLLSSSIYSRVYYYPVIGTVESEKFIRYILRVWKAPKISKVQVKQIVNSCAGSMFLLKHAARYYYETERFSINDFVNAKETLFRVGLIAKSYNEYERNALAGKKNIDQTTIDHLCKLGMLQKGKCVIAILAEYLQTIHSKFNLYIKNDSIFANNINLIHSFTDQELITLKLLIANKNAVVTRDQISVSIWHKESDEKFSVWAIEQLIRRIRKKLNEMNIVSKVIVTVRGKGYKVVLPSGN